MIKEIKEEIVYVLILWTIISWGLVIVDIGNRIALWDEAYQNWEYNIDVPVPDGLEKAMIKMDVV